MTPASEKPTILKRDDHMDLPRTLRNLRHREARMTMGEMAREMGVTVPRLSDWERGVERINTDRLIQFLGIVLERIKANGRPA